MIETFDLLGPLPTGTTVLEASAGTGKTYTVGALVARYVAEGRCRLDEMLIITFGRAASQELRERVRDQLVEAAAVLADPSRAEGPLLTHLVTADDVEIAARRRRVLDALASFDSATIATTHQFCQVVLRSLGVAGDTDPHAVLVEDLDDLLVEVVDDLYLSRYGSLEVPPLDRATALALARRVFTDPHTELMPADPPLGSPAAERLSFAREVRKIMDQRKQQRGILSFDDLLSRLNDALEDDDSPARERMRARWTHVLVDEFQDTDPVQWSVLQRAFDGVATLILIGDPKQAIYAFRGGDIDSYLAAVSAAGDRRTLGTNYRSDGPLVDALQVLTRGALLGDDIVVQPVTAAHVGSRLQGAPVDAPIRLRVVDVPTEDGRPVGIGILRDRIAVDVADDIARLLGSDATFTDREGTRPIGAGDVAILMQSLRNAGPLQQALLARGVPCVVADRDSVLTSAAATEWLRLLEALERQVPDRVRSAALTSFFGRTAAELDAGGDPLTDELAERVRELLDLYRLRGVAAVQEATFGRGVAARVLARPDGERLLTDLEHVGEILHDVAHGRRLGVTALLAWLREERRLAEAATSAVERQRRLDTDAAAVQIVTIHASKGLQYPVVYLPHAFNRWIRDVDDELGLRYHVAGDRLLDVGQPFDPDAVRLSRAEDAAEELRLTYVALTRAQSQVVLWWGRSRDARNSGLSRLLIGRAPESAVVRPALDIVPPLDEVMGVFRDWETAGGLVLETAESSPAAVEPAAVSRDPLVVRTLDREVDTDWRRTSYTGLLRAAEHAGIGAAQVTEPEVLGTIDEDVPDDDAAAPRGRADAPVEAPVSPMADLPAGAAFGSLVHAVLELADPQAGDLEAELTDVVTDQLRWWPVDSGQGALSVSELVAGLVPMHDTPLGPMLDNLTLRDIGRSDRLCELDFEIPLAGGDRPVAAAEVTLAQVADALRRHLPADDILAGYADHLTGPLGAQVLRGYLGGSIDVVLRVGDDPRYVVVDYKTNRLGLPDQPLTALDYVPQHMAASMMHSHYPLQAILYSVVLHRYLRWRVRGYDPDRHLGGIAYLYVRGMCGPQTPVVDGMPCGVFAWRPPAALVVELSDLLAGGAA